MAKYLVSIWHFLLASCIRQWLSDFAILFPIIFAWLPYLYFLPGSWPISILLNQFKWQICTVYKMIIPQQPILLTITMYVFTELFPLRIWQGSFNHSSSIPPHFQPSPEPVSETILSRNSYLCPLNFHIFWNFSNDKIMFIKHLPMGTS